MQIENWPLDRLKPYANNPRQNQEAVPAVVASIREFGFKVPIIANRDGVIVAGHTRYLAAKDMGMETVPVIVADDLTPAQIQAFRISDNKTAEIADWDYDLLPIELAALKELDFDLDLIGFSSEELADLLNLGIQDGFTDPDEVPEPPDEAITQPGDLCILGEHRLLCGDSANPDDVNRLLDGNNVRFVNTDPPYGVKVEPRSNNAIAAGLSSFANPNDPTVKRLRSGHGNAAFDIARGKTKVGTEHHQQFDLARHPEKSKPTQKKLRAKDRPVANDFLSDEDFERLLYAWFGNIARVLLPGRCFVIWGGYANLANYPPALKASQLYFSQAIVWDKEHPVLTRKDRMGSRVERVEFAWERGKITERTVA